MIILINSLDEDRKFIFENPSRTLNFLDIQWKIVNNTLVLDIYYKPRNSFNYLTYSSCHPSHTNRERRLSELKKHLTERNHQPKLDKNKDLKT